MNNNNNLTLVPYNPNSHFFCSTLGESWKAAQRALYILANIPSYYLAIFVGLILSDGPILRRRMGYKNASLELEQSFKHSDYLWFVFYLLLHFCKSKPTIVSHNVKGIVSKSFRLRTRSLPFLTELYNLFYVNGIKIIPSNIYDLLTPVALAHWIMGDGITHHSGLELCTHSFTIVEVVRLINVLMIRYRLDCNLRIDKGKPVIYIRAHSMPHLRTIVQQHFHPSMFYKQSFQLGFYLNTFIHFTGGVYFKYLFT